MWRQVVAIAAVAGLSIACEQPLMNGVEAIANPPIDAAVLPPSLPPAVSSEASAVSLVQNDEAIITDMVPLSESIQIVVPYAYIEGVGGGSAVDFEGNEYITAAHVIKTYSTKTSKHMNSCGNVSVQTIDSMTEKGTEEADGFPAIKEAAIYGNTPDHDDSSTIPDIALVEMASPPKASMNHITSQKLGTTALHIGQPVYFMNYQPTASGKIRTPDTLGLTQSEIRAHLNTPAIYGGVVFKKISNGDYFALTGLKSYGLTRDSSSLTGASGGPVYEADGKLVGIVVEGYTASQTVATLLYGAPRFTHIPNNQPIEATLIQPITEQLVKKLSTKLAHAALCHN